MSCQDSYLLTGAAEASAAVIASRAAGLRAQVFTAGGAASGGLLIRPESCDAFIVPRQPTELSSSQRDDSGQLKAAEKIQEVMFDTSTFQLVLTLNAESSHFLCFISPKNTIQVMSHQQGQGSPAAWNFHQKVRFQQEDFCKQKKSTFQ